MNIPKEITAEIMIQIRTQLPEIKHDQLTKLRIIILSTLEKAKKDTHEINPTH